MSAPAQAAAGDAAAVAAAPQLFVAAGVHKPAQREREGGVRKVRDALCVLLAVSGAAAAGGGGGCPERCCSAGAGVTVLSCCQVPCGGRVAAAHAAVPDAKEASGCWIGMTLPSAPVADAETARPETYTERQGKRRLMKLTCREH